MLDNSSKHIVSDINGEHIRLHEYILGKFPLLQTRSSVKKALKRELIIVNGSIGISGYVVCDGDIISMKHPVIKAPRVLLDIPIIYEDEHLAVINKPAGIVCSGNKANTISSQLYHLLRPSKEEDRLPAPLLVHRLDRATSGLLIVAKTQSTRVKLGHMLASQEINKEYHAIVEGYVDIDLKKINSPIDGKEAITYILDKTNLSTRDKTSLIKIKIESGRTHQIRIHMTNAGHPLVGDQLYNADGLSFGRGLFLVASSTSFSHPHTGEQISLSIELPQKYKKYIGNNN